MRRAAVGLATCVVALLAAGSASATTTPTRRATLTPVTSPFKVMEVGDSRSEGGTLPGPGDDNGSRWELIADLIFLDQLYGSDLVGDHAFGPAGMRTSAHSGWNIAKVSDAVVGWISTYRPNVILLEIGVNDAREGRNGDQIAADMGALLAKIMGADPAVRVIVADIPPPWYGTGNDVASLAVMRFNELLPGVVNAADPRVTLAKQTAVVSNKFGDGLHPDAEGHVRRAYMWHECMRRIMAPGLLRGGRNALDVPVPYELMCPPRN